MAISSLHPDHIQGAEFGRILQTYDDHIGAISTASKSTSTPLAELDAYLFGPLQDLLKARLDAGTPHFELSELGKCIEWKLKHGKFRPNLLNLALSNSPSDVKKLSEVALGKLPATTKPPATAVMDALAEMSKLRGIGPASASLLLSITYPEHIPFFSDEAYRWVTFTGPGKGDPWKRPIKYNKQEYLAYLAGVDVIALRLHVKASDVERVGWLLGRDNADVSAPPPENGEESD